MLEPIDLPERPANARSIQPSESTRQRWARMARIADNAREEGFADGLRTGHGKGFVLGMLCGAVAGAVVASMAWSAWLMTAGAAQDAAPPARPASATRLR